uniref:Syntaxin-binding protein 5 isoform x5 n=1 Tax=Triatoma infestans TaxID=30076 RepID=A0A170UWA4_TRIIF
MKKFTFKGVLDGLRSSVTQQQRNDQEIVETLRTENFQVAKKKTVFTLRSSAL